MSTGFTVEVAKSDRSWKDGTTVRSSASALEIKHIADEWRPSKPGVTMYAAPEKLTKAVGRRGDRTAQSTERNRDA